MPAIAKDDALFNIQEVHVRVLAALKIEGDSYMGKLACAGFVAQSVSSLTAATISLYYLFLTRQQPAVHNKND